jgi:hypothetical protein
MKKMQIFLFERDKKGREFNGLEISLYQDRIRDKGYTRIKLKQIKNRRIKAPKPISNSQEKTVSASCSL